MVRGQLLSADNIRLRRHDLKTDTIPPTGPGRCYCSLQMKFTAVIMCAFKPQKHSQGYLLEHNSTIYNRADGG